MKVAVIGSRDLSISNLRDFLPEDVTEIVSGGARGVDTSAKRYAVQNNLSYREFLPEYEKYGRAAPLRRNIQIIEYADLVLAFWDGESPGTKFVIEKCKKMNVPVRIFKKGSAR